jgi:hypothetical protein
MRKKGRRLRLFRSLSKHYRRHTWVWVGSACGIALILGVIFLAWSFSARADRSAAFLALSIGTPNGGALSSAPNSTSPVAMTLSPAPSPTLLPARSSTAASRPAFTLTARPPALVFATPTPLSPTAPASTTPMPISPTQAIPECGQPGSDRDWKTYSNADYQFSIRYPQNLVVIERNQKAADILASVRLLLQRDVNVPQPNEIDLTIFDNPLSQNTGIWFESHRKNVSGSAALFENVTNKQACLLDRLDALAFQESTVGPIHRILAARGNRVQSILVTDYGNPDWVKTFLAVAASFRWN